MSIPLRVLLVEDSENDAIIVLRELKREGYDCHWRRVETREQMNAALDTEEWDVVLSDYTMPRFDAPSALKLFRERGFDKPFIVVSGSIGEDIAVEAMRAGANDYVMKGNLGRLLPALKRELADFANRQLRRQAEGALLQSEERLRLFIEGVRDHAIFMLDPEGRIINWNVGAQRIFGYADSEVLGRPFACLFADEDVRMALPDELLRKAAEGRAVENDHWFVHKDGKRLFISGTMTAIYDNKDGLHYFANIARDITERKTSEEEQQFLAELSKTLALSLNYELTLEKLAALLVPAIADCCFIDMIEDKFLPKRIVALHADPGKADLMKDLQEAFDEHPANATLLIEVLRTGKAQLFSDVPVSLASEITNISHHEEGLGALFMRSAMIVPLKMQNKVLGLVTLLSCESGRSYSDRDLAFALQLAQQASLAVANARLYRDSQAINQMKDEFLATVSHELRTPINVIQGFATLLLEAQGPIEDNRTAIEAIYRNSKIQVNLVDDLLDASRTIIGKFMLDAKEVEIVPILRSVVDEHRILADAKGISMTLDIDETPGLVYGDPVRLQQVIWNLLSNAVKFTPQGGDITITHKRVNSYIEILVQDSGEGIHPRFLPFVFDRFRQQDSSKTRRHGGLGLGLSIVRHLVELHGGTVTANSEGPGKGSTFQIRLPMMPALVRREPPKVEEAEIRAKSERSRALEGLNILIVDDAPDVLALVGTLLRYEGARVRTAGSAYEALEKVKEDRPEVLLSDIGMPGEDGFALIRKVRALDQGSVIAAAALTAYTRDEERQEALNAGFEMHLAKPVEIGFLLKAVEDLARIRKSRVL